MGITINKKPELDIDGSRWVEIAKGASENDLKEFWHVGRDLAPGDPLAETMPPNVWPTEMPAFRDVFAPLRGAAEFRPSDAA